jgi:hypothetical protein
MAVTCAPYARRDGMTLVAVPAASSSRTPRRGLGDDGGEGVGFRA